MKKIITIVLFITSFLACNNKYEIEKEAEKCFFSSFGDKEIRVKSYINEYESILIEENILKNSSKEAYYTLFKEVTLKNFQKPIHNYSLFDSINKITAKDFVEVNLGCNEKIEGLKGYNNSVSFKIREYLKSVQSKKNNQKEIIEGLLEIYPSDYFELTLHKLQILLLIDRLSKN